MQSRVNARLFFENLKNVVPQILINYPVFVGYMCHIWGVLERRSLCSHESRNLADMSTCRSLKTAELEQKPSSVSSLPLVGWINFRPEVV